MFERWRAESFANFFIFSTFYQENLLRFIKPILLLCLVVYAGVALGQKQLILLKGENVLLRLYPGDEIVYKLKGSKTVKTTYVNNLSDTAVVTHRDIVPFHTIEKIYFRQARFYNKIGAALVVFGAGLFIIDQLNVVVVNGQSPNLDSRVSTVSLASLAVGVPLILLKKKSQKLKYRYRLMTVSKGSAFYQPDTRHNILPYMDN